MNGQMEFAMDERGKARELALGYIMPPQQSKVRFDVLFVRFPAVLFPR